MSSQSDRRYNGVDQFDQIVNAPALFGALVAALEVDLFVLLGDSVLTLRELAERVEIPVHSARVLAFCLCVGNFLERDTFGYRRGASAERLVSEESASAWRQILIGWRDVYFPALSVTAHALRDGRNVGLDGWPGSEDTLYARIAHSPEAALVFDRSMAEFSRITLPGLLDHLCIRPGGRVLDVGGGDGTTARAIVDRFDSTSVDVAEIGRVVSARSAQSRGVRFLEVDLLSAAMPQVYDAVTMCHFLEVFRPDAIRRLIRMGREALVPGGMLYIYGLHASASEESGLYAARLSLYLNVLASGGGMTYPVRDYVEWCHQSGFAEVSVVEGLPYDHGLIRAVR